MKLKLKRGFTLLEVIVVVGIIAVLGIGIFSVLSPSERMNYSRDVLRAQAAQNISKAMKMAVVNNNMELPSEFDSVDEGIPFLLVKEGDPAGDTYYCSNLGYEINKINISSYLEPYIGDIPVDPGMDENSEDTGYFFVRKGSLFNIGYCDVDDVVAYAGYRDEGMEMTMMSMSYGGDSCGDANCTDGETCSTCPSDCGACLSCGDGLCTDGENCDNCVADCGTCQDWLYMTLNQVTSTPMDGWDETYIAGTDGVTVDGDDLYVMGHIYGYIRSRGTIAKYDKDTFEFVDGRMYGVSGQDYAKFNQLIYDDDYLYVMGTDKQKGAIVTKIDKSDWSLEAATEYLSSNYSTYYSGSLDGNYLYLVGNDRFGTIGGSDGLVVKVNKSDLSLDTIKDYGTSTTDYFLDAAYDDDYIYAVGYKYGTAADSVVAKISKSDLSLVASKVYTGNDAYNNYFRGVLADDDYVYVVGETSSEGEGYNDAIIMKLNKSDLSIVSRKIYGNNLNQVLFDVHEAGNYIYAVGYTGRLYSSPMKSAFILKINKSNLGISAKKEIDHDSSHVEFGNITYDGTNFFATGGTSYIARFPDIAAGTFYSSPSAYTLEDVDYVYADSNLNYEDADFTSVTPTRTYQNATNFVYENYTGTTTASYLISCTTNCATPPPDAYCGDATCNGDETCSTCSGDCGLCAPSCGDEACNGDETCETCAADCGSCPVAGVCSNGICEWDETCGSCAADCGACDQDCSGISVGSACGGGIVIQNNGDGTGIIAATENSQGNNPSFAYDIPWGCNNTLTNANSSSNGSSNTELIKDCVHFSWDGAGKVCYNETMGGRNDWYLPSQTELYKIYESKSDLGITSGVYYSSTEVNSTNAYTREMSYGNLYNWPKSNTENVRCVRPFVYSGTYCGDATCNGDETCETCAADCGECAAVCGDGDIEGDEVCDDNNTITETQVCGNNIVESGTYCNADCSAEIVLDEVCDDNNTFVEGCGNATIETAGTYCNADCSAEIVISSNEICDSDLTQSCVDGPSGKTFYSGSYVSDGGACASASMCTDACTSCLSSCTAEYCGDGTCNNGESKISCPQDCGGGLPSPI